MLELPYCILMFDIDIFTFTVVFSFIFSASNIQFNPQEALDELKIKVATNFLDQLIDWTILGGSSAVQFDCAVHLLSNLSLS